MVFRGTFQTHTFLSTDLMSALDFGEVAALLNHSRTTQIDSSPIGGTPGRWSLHQGWHAVHTSRYPFAVLYLQSAATLDDIRAAARELKRPTDTHVVFPPTLARTIRQNAEIYSLFKRAKGIWTTKEYLVSFIKDELQAYLQKLGLRPPEIVL